MMKLSIASLHLYPVKSLGGFNVSEARTTDRGFEHDRRWMLVDVNGRFMSQREISAMACLHCSPIQHGFRVTDIRTGDHIDLPWQIENGRQQRVRVWDDEVDALHPSASLSTWFTNKLGPTCSLVFMPDASERTVDPHYAKGITSFSDGFPYLITSQASLDDLNARLGADAVPMDRFRPNIVIAGGTAFQEDTWKELMIGGTHFSLVKPCARCVITTTDQRTGLRAQEPLRTLASYRKRVTSEGTVKVDFGVNAMAVSGDVARVGDPITSG